MALSEQQYDRIMESYYENQFNNRALEQDRKEEIYQKIPRIEEIDNQIATSSIQAARAKLLNQDISIEKIKEDNRTLIAEKNTLLEKNGYPADYLQPIYTCPKCKDTGKINQEYCSCFKQAALTYLYKQSTIEDKLKSENFDVFCLDYYTKETSTQHPTSAYDNAAYILKQAKAFVDGFDQNGGNLLFYGGTGLGKTFLSNCIAKALLDTNHTVLYQSSVHLFEDICADVLMKKGNNPNSQELYHYLFDCDLLIIDDLGTETKTSFITSEVYDILNTRMRENKSTLISTNLSIKEISERYTDRVISRILSGYAVYNFFGDDIRLKIKKEEY